MFSILDLDPYISVRAHLY